MLGVVSVVGTVLKFAAKPLLRLANRLPPGTMTGTGGLIAAAGGILGLGSGHVVTDVNIVEILKAVALIITAIGGVVAAFGAQRAHTQT